MSRRRKVGASQFSRSELECLLTNQDCACCHSLSQLAGHSLVLADTKRDRTTELSKIECECFVRSYFLRRSRKFGSPQEQKIFATQFFSGKRDSRQLPRTLMRAKWFCLSNRVSARGNHRRVYQYNMIGRIVNGLVPAGIGKLIPVQRYRQMATRIMRRLFCLFSHVIAEADVVRPDVAKNAARTLDRDRSVDLNLDCEPQPFSPVGRTLASSNARNTHVGNGIRAIRSVLGIVLPATISCAEPTPSQSSVPGAASAGRRST